MLTPLSRLETNLKLLTLAGLALTCALTACSGTGAEPIKLLTNNGQNNQQNPGNDDVAKEASKSLTEQDLKRKLLEELMRYHASSYYLLNPGVTTVPQTGCISYQPTPTLPSRYLRATYRCGWPVVTAKGPLNFKIAGTEDDSPASANDAAKTVTAKADLLMTVTTPKSSTKPVRSEKYERTLKVTPINASTFGFDATSTISNNSTSSTQRPQPAETLGVTDNLPWTPGRRPPHPTPAPSGGPPTTTLDSWSATGGGHWVVQSDGTYGMDKGGQLVIDYTPPNNGATMTVTLDTNSAITFDTKGCPRPNGKFGWTVETGDTTTSGTMTVDDTGLNDDKADGDKIPWPLTCMELTPTAATTPAATPPPAH